MMVRVPLGYCSRVLQQTCPSFRRRLASWTCCDASWTICTSACCSTTAAWAAASPRRRGRALMRFPTQFPSPRVLFSRFDCPIWMVFGWLPFSFFRYVYGQLLRQKYPHHDARITIKHKTAESHCSKIWGRYVAPCSIRRTSSNLHFENFDSQCTVP